MTTDLVASDGLDMTYRASAGIAQPLFPASALHADECLLWPGGAVVVNNTIYLFATAVKQSGGQCQVAFENILATVDPVTLEATRLVTVQDVFGPHFGAPIRVSEPDGSGGQINWVYMVGIRKAFGLTGYLLARVLEANITNPTQYQYWNGSSWVTNSPSAAASIFGEALAGQASLAYNQYLGKYLIVYSCASENYVCARTANTPGTSPSALVGGWSEPVALYGCPGEPGLICYQGFQHTEYGSGATLYITTARLSPETPGCTMNGQCACSQYRYGIRMREITLGTAPPPPGRLFADAARDYSPKSRCDSPVQGLNR